jgi:N4-bis(aminopropyl)spermidine synthase
MREPVDLRAAVNAVSDVVQNRPRPIRNFDQIYMKSGDMVVQSEIIADWADDKRLAFIGDGDAISVCVAYLQAKEILGFGPRQITVFDFDERQVNAVLRFADAMRLEKLRAALQLPRSVPGTRKVRLLLHQSALGGFERRCQRQRVCRARNRSDKWRG